MASVHRFHFWPPSLVLRINTAYGRTYVEAEAGDGMHFNFDFAFIAYYWYVIHQHLRLFLPLCFQFETLSFFPKFSLYTGYEPRSYARLFIGTRNDTTLDRSVWIYFAALVFISIYVCWSESGSSISQLLSFWSGIYDGTVHENNRSLLIQVWTGDMVCLALGSKGCRVCRQRLRWITNASYYCRLIDTRLDARGSVKTTGADRTI